MKVMACPSCSQRLEVDSSWVGMEAECPYCQAKFIIPIEHNIVKAFGKECDRPVVLWVGLIWLYAMAALGIIGSLVGNQVATIGVGCLLISGVYRTQQGSNKARIAITSVLGLITILCLVIFKVSGLVFVALYGIPILLLWLPPCNAWFKEQQKKKSLNYN